jgi:hypothetical protein
MQYKTMALELIRSRPALYRRLRAERRLLPALERHARELRAGHHGWTDRLSCHRPGADPQALTAEALELALAELTARLDREGSPAGSGDAP